MAVDACPPPRGNRRKLSWYEARAPLLERLRDRAKRSHVNVMNKTLQIVKIFSKSLKILKIIQLLLSVIASWIPCHSREKSCECYE